MNDTRFFEKKLDVIAFDTEGQKPPTIAQLCADPKHVYIFELDKHMEAVKKLLADGSVKKIVCDLAAEQAQMGLIANAFDLQDSKKKSLVTIIHEKFGISMYKNKRIHFKGWNLPLSDDQIDYAAADAIWTYLCYRGS
jgi:ribonuclease D